MVRLMKITRFCGKGVGLTVTSAFNPFRAVLPLDVLDPRLGLLGKLVLLPLLKSLNYFEGPKCRM